jgi:hypothetical protein
MKKALIIFAVVAAVAVTFGFAGSVYAQTTQPPVVQPGYGPGMMGGYGPRGGGMMGGARGAGTGFMHDEMVTTFAEKLGISVDDLNARLTAGERMYDIAAEKGMTIEDFTTLMTDVRAKALDNAVADGSLTQEQADFMKTRGAGMMGGRGQGRGAAGGCPFATQSTQ